MVKIRTAEELAGMTVNERLYATDQFDEFDTAVASQNEPELRRILKLLHVGEVNVDALIEEHIKGPSR